MMQEPQAGFRNILVAVDFSAISGAVLAQARALAGEQGASVTVLHVVPAGEYQFGPPDKLESARRAAAAKLEQLAAGQTFGGQPARTLVENGEVAHVVDEVIRRDGHDLLLLGTAGRRGLQRFVMGSVAEEILRSLSIPVITLGPKAAHHGERAVRQIVVATDFSEESKAALPWAAALAQRYRADVALVHVVPAVLGEDAEATARTYRERLRQIAPPGLAVPPELMVKFGDVEDQILEAARERDADLIVLGIRGGGGFERARTHLLGPTTAAVIAQAECPVLTVRAG
jgi:nucleotide-binding universal stress UspA family protein